ncbi:hypothetical protein CsSME_00042084 [Camellia sinensis var. sinensis]
MGRAEPSVGLVLDLATGLLSLQTSRPGQVMGLSHGPRLWSSYIDTPRPIRAKVEKVIRLLTELRVPIEKGYTRLDQVARLAYQARKAVCDSLARASPVLRMLEAE